MQRHDNRDLHRLDDNIHQNRRNHVIAAGAVLAAGLVAVAGGDRLLADDDPIPVAAPAPIPASECGPLWARVQVSGRPGDTVESAAAAVGLVARGPWISADGLTFEHLDGRVVVVARPRPATPSQDATCALGAVAGEWSRP
jgi:hypothetical protein